MLGAFRDRRDAGRRLAIRLMALAGRSDLVVLALPRGGVPVAFEVARALDAPLDLLLVRKLGVPGHEELAMGAIASAGASGVVRILNSALVRRLRIPPSAVEEITEIEERELQRRERAYRGDRAPIDVTGRTVILVDDGLATGATMLAAVAALREHRPGSVVVAVPVGSVDTCAAIRDAADECVCDIETHELDGVGRWYDDFSQTSDAEVLALLAESGRPAPAPPAHSPA